MYLFFMLSVQFRRELPESRALAFLCLNEVLHRATEEWKLAMK